MGKKLKKKARSGQRDKRVSSASPKTDTLNSVLSNSETIDDKARVVKERKICSHLDKGVDLDKLSAKLGSSGPVKCEDCREDVNDRRAKSGKSKHGKKKGGVDPKSETKKIWVCLGCGHFSCGGVGFPTKPQTHAIRHSKQNHHPLALQFDNPQLCWCFTCSALVPAEKSGDGVGQTDLLLKIMKMIKTRHSEVPSVDVEDVWFGSGSVLNGSKLENSITVGSDATGDYMVRGLVNLGNTCFFNSVLQNLLNLDRLRNYYEKLDGSCGSLTAALKKLVGEISPGSGLRNAINPKSVFGNICAKAPQFRGFQQQDSHELLRCLLDGLSTEEVSARKWIKSSEKDKNSEEDKDAGSTFVDAIFGGQLLSTVTCLACGHSSIVYEPFLDLSLPVPTKKPPSKRVQSVTQAKTSKLPPRRSGRTRPKLTRDANALPPQSLLGKSSGGKSSCQVQTYIPIPEQKMVSSGDCTLLLSNDTSAIAYDKSLTLDYNSTLQNAKANKDVQNVIQTPAVSEDLTWLDILGDGTVSNIDTVVSQMNDMNLESSGNSAAKSDLLQYPLDCNGEKILSCSDDTSYKDNITNVGHHGQEKLLDTQAVAQMNGTMDAVQNDITLENVTESCHQTHSVDLNLGVGPSGNLSEQETPLMVQDSTVLLLPYTEDTSVTSMITKTEVQMSSSTVGYEQDSVEFDGFGDLFNEPEAAESSALKPSLGDNASELNEVAGAGLVGNSSESEPDEVDNTDAPVSVKSCLAYFTKLELLSKDDHGWQCENCSKLLHEERTSLRKKMQNPGLGKQNNGVRVEDRDTSGFCSERRLVDNGNVKKETLISDVSYMKHKEKVNDIGNTTVESSEKVVMNPVASKMAGGKSEVEVAPVDQVEPSTRDKTFSQLNNKYKNLDDCNANEPSGTGQPVGTVRDAEFVTLTEGGESEGSEDEETNAEMVKVERDANKRILISKAPPILTIHLKRFSQDARGRLSKLNGHVGFDHTIDLKPYMDSRCTDRDKYKYRLVGIVEHSGSMRGGHYVAYIRRGGKKMNVNGGEDYIWYHASDAYVRVALLDEVLRSEAYILFYEQI